MRGLEHLTADDRAPDADVADGERVHVERRIFQHGRSRRICWPSMEPISWSMCNWERRTERGGPQRPME